jgi:hypothetical protein
MPIIDDASELYFEAIESCVKRITQAKGVAWTKDQWLAQRESGAFPILAEMWKQVDSGEFDRARLEAVVGAYTKKAGEPHYQHIFKLVVPRWPNAFVRPVARPTPGRNPPVRGVETIAATPAATPAATTAIAVWVRTVNSTSQAVEYQDLASGDTRSAHPGHGTKRGERASDWTAHYHAPEKAVWYENKVTGTTTWYLPAAFDYSGDDVYELATLPAGARGVDVTGATIGSAAGGHLECDQWVVVREHRDGPQLKNLPVDLSERAREGFDYEYAVHLATHAVRRTRQLLKNGCFNNTKASREFVSGARAGGLNKQLDEMFTQLQYDKSNADDWVPLDPLTQLAARVHATIAVEGGVCSALSAVVAADIAANALTLLNEDGSVDKHATLQVLSHDADHSFVVVRFGDSPWIVADPWPADSYAVPWEECYFPRRGVLKYLEIRVKWRVNDDMSKPFGVAIKSQDLRAAKAFAKVGTPPDLAARMQHVYFQPHNLADDSVSASWPAVVDENDWGPGVAV